jgi:hypothetical protein
LATGGFGRSSTTRLITRAAGVGRAGAPRAELKGRGVRADPHGVVGALLLGLVPSVGLLAHELGHGVAALVLTRGPVHVIAGRTPGLVRVRVGRFRLTWHLEPARGVGWDGVCVFPWTPKFLRGGCDRCRWAAD